VDAVSKCRYLKRNTFVRNVSSTLTERRRIPYDGELGSPSFF